MDAFRQSNERLETARRKDNASYRQVADQLNHQEDEIRTRYESLESRKRIVAEAHGDPDACDDDVVEINAGGKVVVARRGTLCQFRGSRLAALFSGRWDEKIQRDNDGRLFLDVNSEAFQTIVDYLNEAAISPPDDPPPLPTAGDEENQHVMDRLLEILGLNRLFDTEIVKDEGHFSALHDWLGEEDSDGRFQLLYRSSRDGPSAQEFHSKCDHRGCTLTLVETENGLIVGGYTSTPWTKGVGSSSWYRANKAFLFVLRVPGEDSPLRKMELLNPTDSGAVAHRDDLGPTFGTGHDLKVMGSELSLCCNSYNWGNLHHITDHKRKHPIKEVEVFRVSKTLTSAPTLRANGSFDRDAVAVMIRESNSLSNNVKGALDAKLRMLNEAELEIANLEGSFDDETAFVDLFARGERKDTVRLNVSGTAMATKRSTLLMFKDSVLARQFDDAIWTDQQHGVRSNERVRKWTPDDVADWVRSIDGVADDVAGVFRDNDVTGRELLALGIEGLRMIGIRRPATICLLRDEIRRLDDDGEDGGATLIEHGPYCFGKMLDHLRAKSWHSAGLVEAPDLPAVRGSERGRFERVVGYFFPGEGAELVLGVPGCDGRSALNHYLLHFINYGAQNEVCGVHVREIIDHLSSQGFSEEDIRNALIPLAMEGYAYFTNDDHWHFGSFG